MTPGIHQMSMETYQKDPAPEPSLSYGIANILVTQSPLHAWYSHVRLNPNYVSSESDTFDLGSCAHSIILEGEAGIEVIDPKDYPSKTGSVPEGWTNKAIKAARDAARQSNKIPVLSHKMEECRAMATVARKTLAACEDLKIDLASGLAERVLLWKSGDTWCRARPDWMSADRKIILDYKTTGGSAEPTAWTRNQLIPMGYDLQAAHYLSGNAALGVERATWLWLVQENFAPYACSIIGIPPSLAEIGEGKRKLALSMWERCMSRHQWPGYPKRIAYADVPAWAMMEGEERRLSFDEILDRLTV